MKITERRLGIPLIDPVYQGMHKEAMSSKKNCKISGMLIHLFQNIDRGFYHFRTNILKKTILPGIEHPLFGRYVTVIEQKMPEHQNSYWK